MYWYQYREWVDIMYRHLGNCMVTRCVQWSQNRCFWCFITTLIFHNYIDLDEMNIQKRFPAQQVCIPTDALHQGFGKISCGISKQCGIHWGQTTHLQYSPNMHTFHLETLQDVYWGTEDPGPPGLSIAIPSWTASVMATEGFASCSGPLMLLQVSKHSLETWIRFFIMFTKVTLERIDNLKLSKSWGSYLSW